MSDLSYNMQPIESKPSKKNRKGSKYDPILDAFTEGHDTLVTVNGVIKDANYLRQQLNKRIEARNLNGIKVSVVNNVCYLEKV